MIADFLQSWPLFHNTYIMGLLIAVLLSVVGIVVVARDQIFIGAAVSQASMLGIAISITIEETLSLTLLSWYNPNTFHTVVGGLFAVLAALVTARPPGGRRIESPGSVTGWVFLIGAAGSVLVVAHTPHGLEEVGRLLSSTIIGVRESEVPVFGALTFLSSAAVIPLHRRVLLLVLDRDTAGALGMNVVAWEAAICVWLGAAIGFSIHVAGMTYSFGCLVLPVLIAKHFCRQSRTIFLAAPAVALLGSLAAFVLANHHDYRPGQVAVVLLSLVLVSVWGARLILSLMGRRRRCD